MLRHALLKLGEGGIKVRDLRGVLPGLGLKASLLVR